MSKRPQPNDSAPTCDGCNGICCRHVAIEIDKPTSKREYEDVIWYLWHEGVSVFVEDDGKWYVEFSTPCSALMPHGLCAAYNDRPQVCRDYDVNVCVRHAESSEPVHEFRTPDEYIRHLESKGIDWRYKRRPAS